MIGVGGGGCNFAHDCIGAHVVDMAALRGDQVPEQSCGGRRRFHQADARSGREQAHLGQGGPILRRGGRAQRCGVVGALPHQVPVTGFRSPTGLVQARVGSRPNLSAEAAARLPTGLKLYSRPSARRRLHFPSARASVGTQILSGEFLIHRPKTDREPVDFGGQSRTTSGDFGHNSCKTHQIRAIWADYRVISTNFVRRRPVLG